MSSFTLNISNSATPVGLYRVQPAGTISRGELVYLRMPIKRVLALPGDHVRFTAEGIYVNGELKPNTAPEPRIPHYPFGEYVVPDYFFVGDGTLNPDSWGSRYAGFIPQSIVRGKVVPQWLR